MHPLIKPERTGDLRGLTAPPRQVSLAFQDTNFVPDRNPVRVPDRQLASGSHMRTPMGREIADRWRTT
jgi:hypothetical protein